MKEIYVVNCCRTAVGSFGGSLKDTPAPELGAVVVKEALSRAGVEPEQVDELMFGCILTAAQTVTFINRTVLQHKPCLLRIVKNIHMLTSMFLLLVSILKLTV